MSSQRFSYLYQLYVDDKSSEKEHAELMELIRNAENDETLKKLMEETWHAMDNHELPAIPTEEAGKIYQRIKASTFKRKPKDSWLKIAASLLLVASIGLIIYQAENKNRISSGYPLTKDKIIPAGNKAILTLANGSRVTLNDMPRGQVIHHGSLNIKKSANGNIIFTVDGQLSSAVDTQINNISTPRGGNYQVVLEDGSKVWLNASSSLSFPMAFSNTERRVELSGEAYFEVTKNPDKPFRVRANGTTVQVLGTHFNIDAYPDNSYVTTTLLEGSVKMNKMASSVKLQPGQQGMVKNSESVIAVKKADLEQVMGWRNGYFVFHDEDVKSVMKQVSRWYDVDIEYNDDVSDKEFGGTVSRYGDITELLNNMQLTKAIHYQIKGRKVMIMK